jgi:hypothetical protein
MNDSNKTFQTESAPPQKPKSDETPVRRPAPPQPPPELTLLTNYGEPAEDYDISDMGQAKPVYSDNEDRDITYRDDMDFFTDEQN